MSLEFLNQLKKENKEKRREQNMRYREKYKEMDGRAFGKRLLRGNFFFFVCQAKVVGRLKPGPNAKFKGVILLIKRKTYYICTPEITKK